MARYKTYTTVGDMGPFVDRLILELPQEVRPTDCSTSAFSVYIERMDLEKGGVALSKGHTLTDAPSALVPSRGYVRIKAAYPCTGQGAPCPVSSHVALELDRGRLTKRIDGDIMRGSIRGMEFRVTQLEAFPAASLDEAPTVGLVWNECAGDVCPQLDGWNLEGRGCFAGVEMRYAWYTPDIEAVNALRAQPGFFHGDPLPGKLPLVVWLHGAGEGQEPYRTITGNKVVALGEADIQAKLGGAAYVLAPSCPTFWMDTDGSNTIADDNQSCYVEALKALIDEFIAARASSIDVDRIYIGGLSNGGFMTCRMIADYPGFFAAAVPVCASWVGGLGTDDEFARMARTPSWWVQVDDDPLVKPDSHLWPSWTRLVEAGAEDVHVTYYDHIVGENGERLIGHFVWINVYKDEPRTDLDGSLVIYEGRPVTLWQWVGKHRL